MLSWDENVAKAKRSMRAHAQVPAREMQLVWSVKHFQANALWSVKHFQAKPVHVLGMDHAH